MKTELLKSVDFYIWHFDIIATKYFSTRTKFLRLFVLKLPELGTRIQTQREKNYT